MRGLNYLKIYEDIVIKFEIDLQYALGSLTISFPKMHALFLLNKCFFHLIENSFPQEEKLRDKPGYEHLNEPLHVLVEAELPADAIDAHLNQAVAVLEDRLKPVV